MADNIFYIQAIQELRPGEGFSLDDMDYSTLQFVNNIQKPSEIEILNKFNELKASYNNAEYQRSRAIEYPPITDYLDGIVKGDQVQIDTYIAACQAVKAKYPKL